MKLQELMGLFQLKVKIVRKKWTEYLPLSFYLLNKIAVVNL
jgi:hypothetical protein